jgi:hypothetical protein
MSDTPTTHPYGDGSETPLVMTNGSCELTHDHIEDLFALHGLAAGSFEGAFYPLTDAENIYIADDEIEAADGFNALAGYSVLYKGEKYYAPQIELGYGDNGVSQEQAMDFGRRFTDDIRARVEGIGGHVFLSDDGGPDRGLVQVLIPVSYPAKVAEDYPAWAEHLATVLIASDLKVTSEAQPAP